MEFPQQVFSFLLTFSLLNSKLALFFLLLLAASRTSSVSRDVLRHFSSWRVTAQLLLNQRHAFLFSSFCRLLQFIWSPSLWAISLRRCDIYTFSSAGSSRTQEMLISSLRKSRKKIFLHAKLFLYIFGHCYQNKGNKKIRMNKVTSVLNTVIMFMKEVK